jgi:predicted O-methyltransferase YrrM
VGSKNVERAGFGDMHTCVEFGSEVVLPQLMMKGHQFDFIFNDSNHMFDQTMLEIYYSQKLLKVGGIMMFDDYTFSSVKTALNFMETNLNFSLHPVHHDPSRADLMRHFRVLVKTSQDDREWFHFIPFHVETEDQMTPRMKK